MKRVSIAKAPVLASLAALACFAISTQAATVKTVKQSKVLLALDKGETVEVGDVLNILGSDGSKHATLLVTTTKGRKAIAKIQSGEANIGDVTDYNSHKDIKRKPRPEPTPEPTPEPSATPEPTATPEATPSPEATPAAPTPTPTPSATPLPKDWNVLGGISSDSQIVKLTSSSQVILSGISFFVHASKSGPFPGTIRGPLGRMAWEAGFGVEEIKTTGTIPSTSCKGTGDCVFDITAVSPYGRVGYVLSRPMNLQLRIGADLIVPISVSSNVIDYQAFRPLSLLTAGVFMRFGKKENRSYPFALEYSTYLGNNDVSLTRVMLSGGMTWR